MVRFGNDCGVGGEEAGKHEVRRGPCLLRRMTMARRGSIADACHHGRREQHHWTKLSSIAPAIWSLESRNRMTRFERCDTMHHNHDTRNEQSKHGGLWVT